ncbi:MULTISPECIES: Spy/CpxP family protein refolding chaperone [Bradyrhizobium]|jgi:hypothetical protein|uniref:Spy/CpxP family protein refolding chaperone n=1 Tax=Bradyrhizobium denitrificans TaxID=2734912 RepID=A0ABS5G1W9_9BRAD|nr:MULTISPECIES: Spy/CpxP family protein refolding chaperone [Bradyrhizobium]MBR1135269.1 Spy/CpxP family protein refolding chaperone [Bradyrhizobium denitrificans]MDU1495671.1 Spy/CpxP family protein refolding chaperone [Bradyrhizobium sp.]MDU1545825.1 Spy/CpxP family protein refolding chaperone [Bradyrhizobium sp.]MDU1689715.1 Spy/CpxP family protein refolding chaperone [Bradyrhizobium sp.]MDU1806581.1 Spy/CpxP family protein refolding chaperone [Bradyrhizobium sp.]
MSTFRTLLGLASALAILAAPHAGNSANGQTPSRLLLAMDDMKPMQPDPMGKPGSMNPPAGQPQKAGQDRMMMDDRMKPPAQMQENGMMTMMEKMMRSHMGSMPGMGATSGTTDVTERIEGRIAFLKAEMQITDKQMADWNALADSLRSGRQHLVDARKLLVMDDKTNSADRIEHYERHLAERLEAVRSARTAFTRLYPTLNEAQKQTADTILLPLIATF